MHTQIHVNLLLNTSNWVQVLLELFKTLYSSTCCAEGLNEKCMSYCTKTREYLSLVLNHSKLSNRGEPNEEGYPSATSPGLVPLADLWRKVTAEMLPTITCWTVHHVRCHAVRRSLRVHQARAVVHRLSVGGAGSHNTALIHGRKIALPTRRKSTHMMSHYVPHCWRCCGLSHSTSPIVCK